MKPQRTSNRGICRQAGWLVAAGVIVVCAASSFAAPVDPDDMFFAPNTFREAVYPEHPYTGDGSTTPWTMRWTTEDLRDVSEQAQVTIAEVEILPLLVPNDVPTSEEGEYTEAELDAITVDNYLEYYAQRPGTTLNDPNTDYVADLTNNVLTVRAVAAAAYTIRITTVSNSGTGTTPKRRVHTFRQYLGDFHGEDGGPDAAQVHRKVTLPDRDLFLVSTGDPNDNGFNQNAKDNLTAQGANVKCPTTIQEAIQAICDNSDDAGEPISVWILGHGRPGSVKIGTERINCDADSDMKPNDFGQAIRGKVTSVTIFSCNVAQNLQFLQDLANGANAPCGGWTETVTAGKSTTWLGIQRPGYFDIESGAKKKKKDPPACNVYDLNSDHEINSADLAILMGNFGDSTTQYDVDGDGVVTNSDMSLLIMNYGPCEVEQEPVEP